MNTGELVLVVINHNCSENVNVLRKGFSSYTNFFAIDSGSDLLEKQKAYFDLLLPNVYYSGLVNAAFDQFQKEADDFVLYFVASDVEFNDYEEAIIKVKHAFEDSCVGVYAPSANASSHQQMVSGNGKGLRSVVFVEGFCFAVRLGLLRQLCPVDTSIKQIGWGLEVMLGYLAIKNGQISVVDYEIEVFHPLPSGYDSTKARVQRDAWYNRYDWKTRWFRKWATFQPLNSRIGMTLLKYLIK